MAKTLSKGGSITFFDKEAKPVKITAGRPLSGVPRKIMMRLERADRVADDGKDAKQEEKEGKSEVKTEEK